MTDIIPEIMLCKIGVVTEIDLKNNYIMFDNTDVFFTSHLTKNSELLNLNINQECKYKTIHSTQWMPATNEKYKARVWCIDEIGRIENVEEKIIVRDITFNLMCNDTLWQQKYIPVYNNSSKQITLLEYKFVGGGDDETTTVRAGFVDLPIYKKSQKTLFAHNGKYQIPINFQGNASPGTYIFELETNFRIATNFPLVTKRSKVIIELKEYEYISAVSESPRFISVRIDRNYQIPDYIRSINTLQSSKMSEQYRNNFPFLKEPTTINNYLRKLTFGLYIEQSAAEKDISIYNTENTIEIKDHEYNRSFKNAANQRPLLSIFILTIVFFRF